MRALLDINVIIALLDSAHTLHPSATNWLAREIQHGWASRPITENGVVRIMSQPAHPNTQPAQQVALRIREAQQNSAHRFWPDDISLTASDLLNWPHLLGHRQISDAYLLAIAARNNGRLVTFDQRARHDAVKGRALYTLLSQFSVMRPGTRVNSDSLSVTTTAPNARPWAAIQKSFAPIGVPPLSSCALIKPYCRLTLASRGTNSICSTSRASRAAFFSRCALFSTPSSSSPRTTGESTMSLNAVRSSLLRIPSTPFMAAMKTLVSNR
jgi:uncharacterized protein